MIIVSAFEPVEEENTHNNLIPKSYYFDTTFCCSENEKDLFKQQLTDLIKNPKHVVIKESNDSSVSN
jgi:hypothetical protein